MFSCTPETNEKIRKAIDLFVDKSWDRAELEDKVDIREFSTGEIQVKDGRYGCSQDEVMMAMEKAGIEFTFLSWKAQHARD
jgi:nucleoid DNA-binding protein